MTFIGNVVLIGMFLFIFILIYVYAKMILGFIKSLKGESVDWETRYFWALAIFGVVISPILGLIGHYSRELSAVIFGLSAGIFAYLYLYRYEAKVKKTILWDERTLMIKEKAAYALIKAELLLLFVVSLCILYQHEVALHRNVLLWERTILIGALTVSLVLLLYLLFSEPKLDERERRIREKVARQMFEIELLGTLFISVYFFAVAKFKHIEEYNIYGIAAFAAFIIVGAAIKLFEKYYERVM